MTARLPLRIGSSDAAGDGVSEWQKWFHRVYASYAPPIDGYYGNGEVTAVRELQRRLDLPQTGIFDEVTASRAGYTISANPPRRRKIWIYTAPGSGADWWLGPSFDLGERCKNILKLNHQPVGFAKGGYLGLMGGDPALSYNDVIAGQHQENRRLLLANPDLNHPDLEIWWSGYSQSSDGCMESVNAMFGDGAEFAHLRPMINGLVMFGNPATPTTGIARKKWPDWLNKLTHNVNTSDDFYAVANDPIRPLFYEWFIRAETELPFVIYSAQIIVPALLNLLAPGVSLASPVAAMILGGATGVGGGLLGQVLGGVTASREKPNPELIELLSVRGILTNIPALVQLLAALPGIQSHGSYHLPRPEFGNRTGVDAAYDVIAGFRR